VWKGGYKFCDAKFTALHHVWKCALRYLCFVDGSRICYFSTAVQDRVKCINKAFVLIH